MLRYRMPATQDVLAALLRSHQAIEARIRQAGQSPADVLGIGQRLLEFATREDEAFRAVLPLLDPAARADLAADHEQLGEDLVLLESLLQHTPDSPDVTALAHSLARRMSQHVERDGRLLARAARMAAGSG
jgi:hypothetical protein